MAIEYKKSQAVFSDIVSVDEAEGLLEWLQKSKGAKIYLGACTHLHPANLQVLMAAKSRTIASWPSDTAFRAWLETALKPE